MCVAAVRLGQRETEVAAQWPWHLCAGLYDHVCTYQALNTFYCYHFFPYILFSLSDFHFSFFFPCLHMDHFNIFQKSRYTILYSKFNNFEISLCIAFLVVALLHYRYLHVSLLVSSVCQFEKCQRSRISLDIPLSFPIYNCLKYFTFLKRFCLFTRERGERT